MGRSARTPRGPVTGEGGGGGGGLWGGDSSEQPERARVEMPKAATRPRIKAMRIPLSYPVAPPASPKIRLFRGVLRRVPGMSLARAEKADCNAPLPPLAAPMPPGGVFFGGAARQAEASKELSARRYLVVDASPGAKAGALRGAIE